MSNPGVPGKRCSLCCQLNCRRYECVLASMPALAPTVNETMLGTRHTQNDPFAVNILDTELCDPPDGWSAQDDAAFQFANRVQGIR